MDATVVVKANLLSGSSCGVAGRVAWVTGGSRGLGAATAQLLAEAGALVAVGGRDATAIAQVVSTIDEAGGQAFAAAADSTDEDALRESYAALTEHFGQPVELLAAFAGGNGHPRPTERVDLQEWHRVIDADLTSTFLTVQTALPGMLAVGKGSIVTMSSSAGRQPGRAAAAYACAKAGVSMFTKHLALEMGPQGIRVNCLAPSAILTERLAAVMTAEQQQQLAGSFPLGRLGQPSDVANAAVFLLSENASWITGVTLDISGGRIIT